MTPNEELHAKFFSEEAVLVVGMTDADLDEHIHELETIAREAKARIMASTEEKRNRKAKQGNKAWRVEPLGPDPTVSDSLNKVKQRSARMSKLDKMRDKLTEIGLSDADIDSMLSKMIAQARKDPAALKEEARLKQELGIKQEATIPTDEEKAARAEQKRLFAEQDKADAEKEKEQNAPVHSEKDSKIILTEEKPKVPGQGEPKKPFAPGSLGKLDISSLKFK